MAGRTDGQQECGRNSGLVGEKWREERAAGESGTVNNGRSARMEQGERTDRVFGMRESRWRKRERRLGVCGEIIRLRGRKNVSKNVAGRADRKSFLW